MAGAHRLGAIPMPYRPRKYRTAKRGTPRARFAAPAGKHHKLFPYQLSLEGIFGRNFMRG